MKYNKPYLLNIDEETYQQLIKYADDNELIDVSKAIRQILKKHLKQKYGKQTDRATERD